MFYLMMLPVAVFLVWQYFWFRKVGKHDKHLYRLCQIRRESMDLLINEYEHLPKEDAFALRDNIEVLNILISKYATHKTQFFNFRRFLKSLQELKQAKSKQERFTAENPSVVKIRDKTARAILEAFLAYTPFLFQEVLVRLMLVVVSLAVSAGVKSLTKWLKDMQQSLDFLVTFKQKVKPPPFA